jgi:hypothetical protein
VVNVDSSAPSWARRFADDVGAELERLRQQRRAAPVPLPGFAKADLPSASSYPRCLIFVTDEGGGAVPAFSDGSAWRRVTDRAVVS